MVHRSMFIDYLKYVVWSHAHQPSSHPIIVNSFLSKVMLGVALAGENAKIFQQTIRYRGDYHWILAYVFEVHVPPYTGDHDGTILAYALVKRSSTGRLRLLETVLYDSPQYRLDHIELPNLTVKSLLNWRKIHYQNLVFSDNV